MHLLITGGTGFFGRALLRSKLSNAHIWAHIEKITVLSRHPEHFLAQYPEFSNVPWLAFHQGDIMLPDSLPTGSFSHVLHAAADSTLGPTLTPLERYDQIVTGTQNLLDFCVKSGVKRFLLTSSGAVYGQLPDDMAGVIEDCHTVPDPLDAHQAYGLAKRQAEHLCALYHDAHGLDYVVARCFAFVGRDLPLDVHFAIGNFIRDALYRDTITVKGDGTAVRSYLSQQDLAIWLMTLLLKAKTANAYNVGSDEACTIKALAHQVRDLIAPEKPVDVLGKALATPRNCYLPNIKKAQQELGLQVNMSLADAILDTAQHSNYHE